MKTKTLGALLVASLAAAGCTGDSSRPTATGKGAVRAVHAIPTAPDFAFLIEERLVGTVTYKTGTAASRYDDLEYTFNFETRLAGDTTRTRVASRLLDVVAEREYIFLISGDIGAPAITLWESDIRSFEESATVFQVRFSHASESLGPVDFYLDLEGIPPALGQQRATLAFGEIDAAIELPTEDYVITVTAQGDPADVLYRSGVTTFAARGATVLTLFDGDANDTAPYVLRGFPQGGATLSFADARFPPTARFVQASFELGATDIYNNDEMLTSPIVTNHVFGDVTAPVDVAVGANEIVYTQAGNIGAILFEDTFNTAAGTRTNFVLLGPQDDLAAIKVISDLRPVETQVKLRAYHAASNHERVDMYIVDAGTALADASPALANFGFGTPSPMLNFGAGGFDVYVTPFGEETVLAGPFAIDVVLGDVVELLILDTVDPATAEITLLQ